MTEIFEAIKRSAIKIDRAIKEVSELGYCGDTNCSGEQQLKLDVKSDLIIEEEFLKVESIKCIASEEKDKEFEIHPKGRYLIAYDPLDGSSLVDVNLSVGSIFGVYENSFKGPNLIASAYVVYGPRVELVLASLRVERFVLKDGEFVYMHEIMLEEKGRINAPGGTQKEWYPHHKKLIETLFNEGYRLRYSGGMVPDLHQILIKGGGLFSYPGTKDKPKGKLRKLFEVFPFALIYEKAGGEAIDDVGHRLLELPCSEIHETTPCFFGSKYEIERVREFYNVPK